jgi:hypothetical protein
MVGGGLVVVHFFSPMCAGQVTVEVIIQISKQFATPFSGFFAKLGKSPKKGRIRVGLDRNGPIRVCVLAQIVYTQGVGSDDPAFGERKNPLVGLVMHFTLTECWPVKPKLH